MHKIEPSKLQYLALQFAEKAAVFVENNERMLDSKTGANFYKEQGGGKGAQSGQQGQDRRQDRNWQEVSLKLPKKAKNKNKERNKGRGTRQQDGIQFLQGTRWGEGRAGPAAGARTEMGKPYFYNYQKGNKQKKRNNNT